MQLYTVRQFDWGFRVVKFDEHVNVLGTRSVWKKRDWHCTCPRGERLDCRHRIIVRLFENNKRVDTGWFYDWDTERWERPINDLIRIITQKALKERAK